MLAKGPPDHADNQLLWHGLERSLRNSLRQSLTISVEFELHAQYCICYPGQIMIGEIHATTVKIATC